MDRSYKVISRTLIFSLLACLLAFVGCNKTKREYPQTIFKSKILNDSLDCFLYGAVDIPVSNYPTVTYVCVSRYTEDTIHVEFVSSPGYHIFSGIDSTLTRIGTTGIYRGKYVGVFCSPSLKSLLAEKDIKKLQLSPEEKSRLSVSPTNLGEMTDHCQRTVVYLVHPSGQIISTYKTDNTE